MFVRVNRNLPKDDRNIDGKVRYRMQVQTNPDLSLRSWLTGESTHYGWCSVACVMDVLAGTHGLIRKFF